MPVDEWERRKKESVIGRALRHHPEATEMLYGLSPDTASRWVLTLDSDLDQAELCISWDKGSTKTTHVGGMSGSGRARVLSSRTTSAVSEVRLITEDHGAQPFRRIFTRSEADTSIWLLIVNDPIVKFVSEERVGPSGLVAHCYDPDLVERARMKAVSARSPAGFWGEGLSK